jgi:hypothetical protein
VPLACTGRRMRPVAPAGGGRAAAGRRPERNLIPTAIEQQLGLLLPGAAEAAAGAGAVGRERAAAQLEAHERVREASRTRGKVTIEPVLPVDILGAYVLLPRD